MIYLIALVAPPLALLLHWHPFHALANLPFWIFGLLTAIYGFGLVFLSVAIIHALAVVANDAPSLWKRI